MIQALLWKQWREWRWLLILGFACWLLPCVLIGQSERAFDTADLLMEIAAVMIPIFFAAGAIARVRTDSGASMTAALPVRSRTVASLTVGAGLVAFALPMALGFWKLTKMAPLATDAMGRTHPAGHADDALYILWQVSNALAIYAWTVFLGAPRRSRTAVLVTGAIVFLGGMVCLALMQQGGPPNYSPSSSWGDRAIAVFAPFQDFVRGELAGTSSLAARFAVMLLLAAIGALRLAGPARTDTHPQVDTAAKVSVLRRPHLKSPALACCWKAFREAWWLSACAIAIDLAAAALRTWLSGWKNWATTFAGGMAIYSFGLWLLLGAVLAIALGVRLGGCESGAEEFWRSRPIPSRTMFLSHYAIGMATPMIIFLILFLCTPRAPSDFNVQSEFREFFAISACTFSATMLTASITQSAFAASCAGCAVPVAYLLAPVIDERLQSAVNPVAILLAIFCAIAGALSWSAWRPRKSLFGKWPKLRPASDGG